MKNFDPNTANKISKPKEEGTYVTYCWQERSDLEMKLRTCQARKGEERKVNRGGLRREREGVGSGTT
jgi:hypothetical protein